MSEPVSPCHHMPYPGTCALTTRARHACCVALAALLILPACQGPPPAPAEAPPGLLVIVAVDQLRADYLDRLGEVWEHGFRRLLDRGAVFDNARFPYANTVTCAGHATIATGTVPATHGIILNGWYRRDLGAQATCTADETARSVPYDGRPEGGHSAHMLLAPTLGDRLRERTPDSRVVAMSAKARSAIMLGGRSATTVTWFGEGNGWATSSAFADAPVPEVAAWVAAHPVDRHRSAVWTRTRPADAYPIPDDGADERPPAGWTRVFPHPLAGVPGTSEEAFYDLWRTSPYADEDLGLMAVGLIEALQLGQRGQTDVLAISFSALDVIGHKFGPDSQEVYDALIRLDRTLGALFDALDAQVGHDRWAMALTADHGVAPIPEARRRTGESAGRIPTRQIAEAVEAALQAELGPGPHVARVDYSEVYFTDATRRTLADTPASDRVMASALAAILKVPGVARAWRASEVAGQRQHEDPVVRMVANGHHPARSGDLVVVSQPYWFFVTGPTPASGDGTTHGTYHDYDVAVPLIFMGPTFAAARHAMPVTLVDLAPTLAAVVGLDMPGAEGQILRAAMAP